MKYPNWNEYDNAKKWKAVADEVKLETNNGTTKADLTNMVKFLSGEAARLQAEVYKAEDEVERLYEINQGCESEARLYDDLLRRCRVENAQLRKVVEAARGVFLGEGEHLCSEFEDAMDRLEQALAELDKDGDE